MENRREFDKVLSDHMVKEENRLTTIENKLQQLEEKIETLETSIKDLVDAWKTAGNVVSFVKWLAGGIAAILALVVYFKSGG